MSHPTALAWRWQRNLRHCVIWLDAEQEAEGRGQKTEEAGHHVERIRSYDADRVGLYRALAELFETDGFPMNRVETDVLWLRDCLGKPYVRWQDEAQTWAERNGIAVENLHVSNSHDGNAHLVFAAYDSRLVGIGIDIVALDRLRRKGKDRVWLHRFARQFMSETEYATFANASEKDEEEHLRIRAAAHFSLMEAASKACGTGLKIGAGMGWRPEALPKQAIGFAQITPSVTFLWEERAVARLAELGATYWEGYWSHDEQYLVSAVVLYGDASARP